MTGVLRYAAIAAVIGLFSSLIGLFLAPWTDGIAFDYLYRLKGGRAAGQAAETAAPVSVIVIDEETYNRPPFAGTPRALWTPHIAAVLNALLDAPATVVGFDTVFATSATGLVRNYDREFLLALHRGASQGRVVIGELLADPQSISPARQFSFAVGLQRNIRPINIRRDPDGVVRAMPLFFDFKEGPRPGFALELAARHRGQQAKPLPDGSIAIGGQPVAGTAGGTLFLDPGVTVRPAPTYSFADIYGCTQAGRDDFFEENFAGRIVLFGSDLVAEDRIVASNRLILPDAPVPGLAGRCTEFADPAAPAAAVSGTMSGVYLHAAAIRQLLGSGGPDRPGRPYSWALLFVTAVVFAAASLTARPMAIAGISLLAIGAPFTAALVFYEVAVVLPLGGLCIAALGGVGGMTGYRRIVLDRDKRYLRRVFSLYLPSSQIDQLVNQEGAPSLGGEERVVTVLFLDIEGFTTISEKLDPAETAALLNNCFDRFGSIIEHHGGYIDKFVGDGLLAIFGAPVIDADHATKSVAAANRVLRSMNETPIVTPAGTLKIRIGVNTGMVLIGNIGSSRRFNYTVIGDTVNLAARLESLNKAYGTYLLVSEETASACRDIALREIDTVMVTGRTQPTKIFEPLPAAGVNADLDRFARALEMYRSGAFADARALFDALADRDPASKALSRRCLDYESAPPGDAWDAVYRPDRK